MTRQIEILNYFSEGLLADIVHRVLGNREEDTALAADVQCLADEVFAPDLPGYGCCATVQMAGAPGLDTRTYSRLHDGPGTLLFRPGFDNSRASPHGPASGCHGDCSQLQVLAVGRGLAAQGQSAPGEP